MSILRSPPQRSVSPANTTYSGISSYRSESYRAKDPKAPNVPQIEPRIIARTHYLELTDFLAGHLTKENQGSRTNAREKLTRLSSQQFQELSTDVYDELVRRRNNSSRNEVPFLPVREDFHPKRNQARQKLATLPQTRFKDLSSDVYFELGRRYPEFKEEPITPGSPTSAYDDSPNPQIAEKSQIPPPYQPPLEESNHDSSHRRRPSDNSAYAPRRTESERDRDRRAGRSIDSTSTYNPGSSLARRSSSQRERERGPSPTTAKSGMIIPNKSTIAEEDPIEVPFGTGSPPRRGDADDGDRDRGDDDSDYGRVSKSPPPPIASPQEQGGLSALTARLAAAGNNNSAVDESDAPSKSNDEYYTPSLYGRSSVASDRSGAIIGHSRSASKAGRNDREIEGIKEELKRDYEFKIATLQKKANGSEERVKTMEEELELLKERAEDHSETMRAMQRELDELRATRAREAGEHNQEIEQWREKYEQLERERSETKGQDDPELISELRSEFDGLLQELRELQGRYDELLSSKEEAENALDEAEQESQDWKRRYENTKTELRALKATSTLHTPQLQAPGTTEDMTSHIPYSADGGVLDVHLTAFQSSVDSLLTMARSASPAKVLTPMKTVVDAVSAAINYPRPQHDNDTVRGLIERLEDTLSNLVIAARNHAQSYGLSPVSLVDAAASHVSETMLELARCVKIRRATSEEVNISNNIAMSPSSSFSPTMRPPDVASTSKRARNGSVPTGSSRANSAGIRKITGSGMANHRTLPSTSDPSSSTGSSSSPIFDTPLSSANIVARDDGNVGEEEGGEEAWSELKPYLEAQSESLVYAIQSVLSSVRSPTPAPSLNEHLTQIITIVSSIVAVCKDSVPTEGRTLLRELSEHCDRLSEVQSSVDAAGGGASKEARSVMAKSSFAVANGMKSLMRL